MNVSVKEITSLGRIGEVIVFIENEKFVWHWEFQTGKYLVYIRTVDEKDWEKHPILSRWNRNEILSEVAKQVCSIKCPENDFEITYESINILEKKLNM